MSAAADRPNSAASSGLGSEAEAHLLARRWEVRPAVPAVAAAPASPAQGRRRAVRRPGRAARRRPRCCRSRRRGTAPARRWRHRRASTPARRRSTRHRGTAEQRGHPPGGAALHRARGRQPDGRALPFQARRRVVRASGPAVRTASPRGRRVMLVLEGSAVDPTGAAGPRARPRRLRRRDPRPADRRPVGTWTCQPRARTLDGEDPGAIPGLGHIAGVAFCPAHPAARENRQHVGRRHPAHRPAGALMPGALAGSAGRCAAAPGTCAVFGGPRSASGRPARRADAASGRRCLRRR
jgi:hypothetical protein